MPLLPLQSSSPRSRLALLIVAISPAAAFNPTLFGVATPTPAPAPVADVDVLSFRLILLFMRRARDDFAGGLGLAGGEPGSDAEVTPTSSPRLRRLPEPTAAEATPHPPAHRASSAVPSASRRLPPRRRSACPRRQLTYAMRLHGRWDPGLTSRRRHRRRARTQGPSSRHCTQCSTGRARTTRRRPSPSCRLPPHQLGAVGASGRHAARAAPTL